MPQHRLFVAIWPDAPTLAAVRDAVSSARIEAPVRWQPERRWHLTLAFLGQVEVEPSIERLDRLVRHGLPAAEPIRISGAGSFGNVVWVGVEHGAWLVDLARQTQRALHVTDRRFRAHMTLARARGRDGTRVASLVAPALAGTQGPAWLPDALTLVQSVTGPSPSYEVLRSWPLPRAFPAPVAASTPTSGHRTCPTPDGPGAQ